MEKCTECGEPRVRRRPRESVVRTCGAGLVRCPTLRYTPRGVAPEPDPPATRPLDKRVVSTTLALSSNASALRRACARRLRMADNTIGPCALHHKRGSLSVSHYCSLSLSLSQCTHSARSTQLHSRDTSGAHSSCSQVSCAVSRQTLGRRAASAQGPASRRSLAIAP